MHYKLTHLSGQNKLPPFESQSCEVKQPDDRIFKQFVIVIYNYFSLLFINQVFASLYVVNLFLNSAYSDSTCCNFPFEISMWVND